MFESVTSEPLTLLSELQCVLDKLCAADLTGLGAQDLLDYARDLESAARRVPTTQHVAVAELEARYLAAEKRCANTAALLVDLLRLDPGQARRRVRDAAVFGPRRGMSGEPLPPLRPATAGVLAAGEIAIEHARVISDLFDNAPALDPEMEAVTESALLSVAARVHPHKLAQFAVQVAARLDQNGAEPVYEQQARRRDLSLHVRPDGTARLSGELTPMCAAALQTVLGPLSAPHPDPDGGTRDERTAGQRRHDGLHSVCLRLLRIRPDRGGLPDSGGAPTTLLVTIAHRDLMGGTGFATTSYGQLLPVKDLLQHAADANLIPVVLNDAGGVMAYGRERRLASAEQRRALAARDGGCVNPGCTAPPEWCEVHHVTEWQHGGRTDIDSQAMVCIADHPKLSRGARIVMRDGVPNWLDPPWLDPSQTPRRNTAHHHPYEFDDLPPPGPAG